MNIFGLNEDERKKFKALIELIKNEFGILPDELEEAIEGIKAASKNSKICEGNFFMEYIVPHRNSYEMSLDIYHNMQQGLKFERAVARCLCNW